MKSTKIIFKSIVYFMGQEDGDVEVGLILERNNSIGTFEEVDETRCEFMDGICNTIFSVGVFIVVITILDGLVFCGNTFFYNMNPPVRIHIPYTMNELSSLYMPLYDQKIKLYNMTSGAELCDMVVTNHHLRGRQYDLGIKVFYPRNQYSCFSYDCAGERHKCVITESDRVVFRPGDEIIYAELYPMFTPIQ